MMITHESLRKAQNYCFTKKNCTKYKRQTNLIKQSHRPNLKANSDHLHIHQQKNNYKFEQRYLNEEAHMYVREARGRERMVHSGNAIVLVAGDVKPSAGVDKGGIPALKHVIGIR